MDRAGRRWEGRRFTDAERFLAYKRILEERSYLEIAGELNCSLRFLYRQFGTQKDRARRTSLRSPLRLSAVEREEISRELKEGASLRAIAFRLGRTPSTISREVKANGGRAKYRAWRADERAVRRLARPRDPKLARDVRLRKEVERLLSDLWSPQQISAHLRRACPDDEGMRISHETIYQAFFVQGRGNLRKELTACLRSGRASRRSQGRTVTKGKNQRIDWTPQYCQEGCQDATARKIGVTAVRRQRAWYRPLWTGMHWPVTCVSDATRGSGR